MSGAVKFYKEPYNYGMDAMTYDTARAKLADTMNRIGNHYKPIIMTGNGEQAMVMMSLEDYKARSKKPPTCCAAPGTRNACWPASRRCSKAKARSATCLNEDRLLRTDVGRRPVLAEA